MRNVSLRVLAVFFVFTLPPVFLSSQPGLFNLAHSAVAAEPPGFDSWVKSAKLAGASLWTGMTQQEIDVVLTDMVNQHVTVIEADSNLSNYLTEAQFEQELTLMRGFVTEAHKRGLRVVWYYPALEVLTPNGANIESTMAKDHPTWVQYGIDEANPEPVPNVFYGGDGRVHWVEKDMESAWMCPESPYKGYFIDRVERIATTGVDGLWADVPLFNDIGVKWAGFSSYATDKFTADTGLAAPGAENWADPNWRRWIGWRHQEIAAFLQDVTAAARAVNPHFPLIVETVTMDYNAATVIALDGADLKSSEGITHVWEVDALSDGDAMRASGEDDWISLIAMNKFARAASGAKPSWVFTYGLQADDAELVMAEALATRNNPYETKIPEMTTTVGAAYRTRMFDWAREHSPYLFDAESGAKVAVLYSSVSRDYVDQAGGVGLYTDTTSSDPLWWSTDAIDSAFQRQYLAEHRGMVKMLVHEHIPFDTVVNPANSAELARYEAVILPDVEAITGAEADILRQYVQSGGNLVVTGPNPTGLDEYGTPRADYALTDLLGFHKTDPLPAESQHSYGSGNVHFYSALLGKDYFVSSSATALQTLSGAVGAASTLPLTTNANRRVHFEMSHLGEETILQFVNFIGVDGALSVVPTTFSVTLNVPPGKQVSGVALTSPDFANTPALNPLPYTDSNQQITFELTVDQYAMVVISYTGAQAPAINNTPVAGLDELSTDVNTPFTLTNALLLANDGDLDGDTLVVTALDAAGASGSLIDEGNGTYTYTPSQDFSGTDTLTYDISDGNGGTDSGIIKFLVAPPTTVYYPTSVTVTVGDDLSDETICTPNPDIPCLKAVDLDTYDIRSIAFNNGMQTDWYATTTIAESPDNIAQIKATHIGSYNRPSVSQEFSVYNFQAGQWELVDTSLVGNEDEVAVSWVANSGISSYVSPQGDVRVRISGFWANTTNLWNWSNALYWEVTQAFVPPDPDTDGDGLSDTVETNTGTYNGPSDTGTDPDVPDTDGDGLLDGAEVSTYSTNPTRRDSDGDGFGDGVEQGAGTSPNNPAGPWPEADGDLAPLNVYNGVVNVGDVVVAGRMALGLVSQDELAIAHGDLATSGTSAGIIDTADVLLMLQQVLNGP